MEKLSKHKRIVAILFGVFLTASLGAQTEKYPIFNECKGRTIDQLPKCFSTEVKLLFYKHFKSPDIVKKDRFEGQVSVVFLVTNQGDFRVVYVNSPYKELKAEVDRVFALFPAIEPAKYNNVSVEMQFSFPVNYPLEPFKDDVTSLTTKTKDLNKVVEEKTLKLADSKYAQNASQLNIPFQHQRYVDYEKALHQSSFAHTASKPYLFNEINQFYDLDSVQESKEKQDAITWVGRKLWNEHLFEVVEDDYWLTIDFMLDLEFGKDNSDVPFTYNNSRIGRINGGIGSKLAFSATIYESQARYSNYVNDFISNPSSTFKPAFSEGLVPGRGKAKRFKEDAFDYPVAEGYLSYTPNKFFQFQFGHGKNFIGDGYRSFVLSDVAAPALYGKARFNLWKFQYTNLWMWGRDSRAPAVIDNEHARKYIAIHYLSIDVSERLTLGMFETAITANQNGIDADFFNPLIFYRSVEFNRGEDSGNAMLGLTARYKLNKQTSLYGQLVIDEFSVGNLNDLGDWRNKFAFQLGAKYWDAFNVDDLFLQAEFNYARPYTFAHRNPVLNYAHYSQPLGHLWGANFWEMVTIANYKWDRFSFHGKLIFGKKGFDFLDQQVSYGGDVYQSYLDRFADTGNALGQGNTANIFIGELQTRYLLNAANNLSLFSSISYRNFSIASPAPGFNDGNNFWFSIGVRADLFNWYFDF